MREREDLIGREHVRGLSERSGFDSYRQLRDSF